jgi:uncharacterized membrane protein
MSTHEPETQRTPAPRWTDHQVDMVIGRLLQVGVLIAAVVTLVGGVLYLRAHGTTVADYHVFRGVPDGLTSLSGIAHGVLAGRRAALVQLGLVLLILTPMARVALTLGAFVVQRDRLYVLLTAIVLAVLVYGLFWARG